VDSGGSATKHKKAREKKRGRRKGRRRPKPEQP